MLRLLFFFGDLLTQERVWTRDPLLLRGKWIETEGRYEPSLGHLIFIDGIPDAFLVTRTLMASQNVVVARLTLRAFAWAYTRNILLSGWYAFLRLTFWAGFLDLDPWDLPSAKDWRWAFWRPRVKDGPPPLQLSPAVRAQVDRFTAAVRRWGW